jgi:hypothetical protein
MAQKHPRYVMQNRNSPRDSVHVEDHTRSAGTKTLMGEGEQDLSKRLHTFGNRFPSEVREVPHLPCLVSYRYCA